MFDSHCHLHDARLLADLPAVVARARAAGVNGLLLAGVEPAGWRTQLSIALDNDGVWNAIGLHPQRVAELDRAAVNGELEQLEALLRGRPASVVAIGETGLDGADGRKATLELQTHAFKKQLELARELNLPLVLHILRAHGPALDILRAFGPLARGGVLHSCSAPGELISDYLRLGFHISFCGPITHPESKKTHQAAREVPLDRLLAETDAPFQTPFSHRGELNEPRLLPEIVQALATARNQPYELIANATADNARLLFGV